MELKHASVGEAKITSEKKIWKMQCWKKQEFDIEKACKNMQVRQGTN